MESPRAITKILLPTKRVNLLRRPRLIDFLHEHIQRKLLLVSASAGYGKTSLLIDFAHDTPLPVCWYSLDASDSDPKIFLEYLITSLCRQFPDFGARTLGLLSDTAMIQQMEVIVGTLVTEIHETIPGYFVLILDDYHTVEESDAINRLLDTLLRLLPENAHLILASRTLPSRLTLTRLTARQEIAGLGTNDLRFTPDEVRLLLQQNYQVGLSQAQAEELAQQSEGWIAGILLTTHSLWQGLFQDLVRVHGPRSYVFNYLASEVFALQSIEVQRFLLDSSVLDQLSPAFCDELLDHHSSGDILRTLEQKNLFIIRLEEQETWFRYHHLFQEFLRARLDELDPARAVELHLRAAALFEARQMWDQAIGHYQRAHAYDQAARVIEQIAKSTFDAGHWTTLAGWIDALPEALLEDHPDVLIARARIWGDTGNLSRALELYASALGIYRRENNTNRVGQTFLLQAVCRRLQGRYEEAVELCDQALGLLDESAQEDIAEAHRTIGISYGLGGDWEKCIEELERALKSYQSLSNLSRVALLHHDLGVARRAAGDSTARTHFDQALTYWRRAGNIPGLVNTLNSIGVGQHRQGDYSRAIEILEQARREAHQAGQLRIEAFANASLGDVFRDQGDYARALHAYQDAFEISQRIDEGFITTYSLNALGETYCRMNELDTADKLMHQALEQAESHNSKYERGLTKTSLGILCCAQGDIDTAVIHLTDAVELLEECSAKRDTARAHLHLANGFFLHRKYRSASQHLKSTAAIGLELKEDQFIVADGQRLLPLIRYAVLKKIGEGYFSSVLQQVRSTIQSDIHPKAAEEEESRLEVRAFGTASVTVDGRAVGKTDWDSSTTKDLFFLLLSHPDGLRKEQILSELWGDVPPPKASGVYHSSLYRMRRALLPDCVIKEEGLYRINPQIPLWYDVSEFHRLLQLATEAKDEEVGANYRLEAIELYGGDFLEESYSDWCAPLRRELQARYLATLLALLDYYERRSDLPQAIAMCRLIIDKDHYREDIYRMQMILQLKSGNPADALKTYQHCVEALEETGLSPSAETCAQFEQIVGGAQT